MKISAFSATLAFAATSLIGLASATGSAQFVTSWVEDGLQRYRFTFQDVSTDNYGQDFLYAIRDAGGITSNWQCWNDPVNGWTFDDSEFVGCSGIADISDAVLSVTGSFAGNIQDAFALFGCELD